MRLKVRINDIKNRYEKYSKLLELKDLQVKNSENISNVKTVLKNFTFPEDTEIKKLRENVVSFNELLEVKKRCEKLSAGLEGVRGQLKALRLPTLDSAKIQGKIERFNTLKSLKEKLDNNEKICYTIQREVKIGEKELSVSLDRQKCLLKEMKICPICKREIDNSCIKENFNER